MKRGISFRRYQGSGDDRRCLRKDVGFEAFGAVANVSGTYDDPPNTNTFGERIYINRRKVAPKVFAFSSQELRDLHAGDSELQFIVDPEKVGGPRAVLDRADLYRWSLLDVTKFNTATDHYDFLPLEVAVQPTVRLPSDEDDDEAGLMDAADCDLEGF
jgi:hypothetical protein